MAARRHPAIGANGGRWRTQRGAAARLALLSALVCMAVAATPIQQASGAASTNYRMDQSVVGSVGGDSGSAGYQTSDTGGEAFVGPTASAGYSLGAGYVPQLESAITLAVDATSVSLAVLPGGTSQTGQTTLTVRTDAPGYTLTAVQNRNLLHTDTTTTVAPVSGTVAVPGPWTEGSTLGLGFTLTSGTALDAKWGSNPNYNFAALPTTATAIHAKDGYQSTDDATVVRYRLAVSSVQKAGSYSNTVTYTALART